MNLPQGNFVNVSGVDATDGAEVVFVWRREKGTEVYDLLGSGHVVGADAAVRPPGILTGQFSVTFLLPPGCSVDDVFVTDDKNSKDPLPGVTVTPCGSILGGQPEILLPPSGGFALRADTTQNQHSGQVSMSSQRS